MLYTFLHNSVGTDGSNVVPENLIILWKLNEAWPQKKNYCGHFITALKAFKTERELNHCLMTLKVFNPEKRRHLCLKAFNTGKGLQRLLRTLNIFKTEKELHHFLETLKGLNFEKWLRQILVTRKICQNSYCTVLCWWTATSQGRLSYHIYDKRTSPASIFTLSDKWYIRQMKLFNSMNCRVSSTPDKLYGSLHPPH